jgi:hypothetical protein
MSVGLLLLNRLLGAVTTFGGVAAAICLGGLLSAAGGDELRSSICWLVCLLHFSICWSVCLLLLLNADGSSNKLRSSNCLSVCLPPLKRVASCLLLLKLTAMCFGLGHSGHLWFSHAFPRISLPCVAALSGASSASRSCGAYHDMFSPLAEVCQLRGRLCARFPLPVRVRGP